MKIPPADEDRKEFDHRFIPLSNEERIEQHQKLGLVGVEQAIDLIDEGEYIKIKEGMNQIWQWIESKRKEWIEYGYKMGKKETSKS